MAEEVRSSFEAVLASKLSVRPSGDYFRGLACQTVAGQEACVIAWEFIVDQLWWTVIVWAALVGLTILLGFVKQSKGWIWAHCIEKRLKVCRSEMRVVRPRPHDLLVAELSKR